MSVQAGDRGRVRAEHRRSGPREGLGAERPLGRALLQARDHLRLELGARSRPGPHEQPARHARARVGLVDIVPEEREVGRRLEFAALPEVADDADDPHRRLARQLGQPRRIRGDRAAHGIVASEQFTSQALVDDDGLSRHAGVRSVEPAPFRDDHLHRLAERIGGLVRAVVEVPAGDTDGRRPGAPAVRSVHRRRRRFHARKIAEQTQERRDLRALSGRRVLERQRRWRRHTSASGAFMPILTDQTSWYE